jgi:hypothetical protein
MIRLVIKSCCWRSNSSFSKLLINLGRARSSRRPKPEFAQDGAPDCRGLLSRAASKTRRNIRQRRGSIGSCLLTEEPKRRRLCVSRAGRRQAYFARARATRGHSGIRTHDRSFAGSSLTTWLYGHRIVGPCRETRFSRSPFGRRFLSLSRFKRVNFGLWNGRDPSYKSPKTRVGGPSRKRGSHKYHTQGFFA